ncbi:MAG: 30S ribosome-binding factor RbfA [Nitrospinota bacterium]
MHPSYPRSARVAELIQSELARMLLRDVKDPRVKDVMITRIELTDDLREASVFFSRYGEGRGSEAEVEEGREGLERASGFLQGRLGKRLRLKRTPRLVFRAERNPGESDRIEQLLSELGGER